MLYFFKVNLKKRRAEASISVTVLAKIIDREDKAMPSISHNINPIQKMENMPKESPLADLLRQVLITCGTNDKVVRVPAIKLIVSIVNRFTIS